MKRVVGFAVQFNIFFKNPLTNDKTIIMVTRYLCFEYFSWLMLFFTNFINLILNISLGKQVKKNSKKNLTNSFFFSESDMRLAFRYSG